LLPLPAGLHLFPHGLRQRRRLRPVRHHLRADAAAVQILRQAGRGMTRERRRTLSPAPLLQHGLLLAAVVITLLPYAWMVSSSFKPTTDIVSDAIELIPRHPILDNYVAAIAGTPVLTAILNSLIMASGETILVVATSVFTAYPFARLRFRGRDTVFLLVLGAMMIPSQVTMIPTFILMKWLGWIDTYQGLIVPRAVTPF